MAWRWLHYSGAGIALMAAWTAVKPLYRVADVVMTASDAVEVYHLLTYDPHAEWLEAVAYAEQLDAARDVRVQQVLASIPPEDRNTRGVPAEWAARQQDPLRVQPSYTPPSLPAVTGEIPWGFPQSEAFQLRDTLRP